jgi:hypothetical protein
MITPWEERFLSEFDYFTILEIKRAAEYMDIHYLLAVCYQLSCKYDRAISQYAEF